MLAKTGLSVFHEDSRLAWTRTLVIEFLSFRSEWENTIILADLDTKHAA